MSEEGGAWRAMGSSLSTLWAWGGAGCSVRVGPVGSSSAQLKASSTLDGIEQLAPQKGLIVELGEFQQVHAGAGRGEPLKVRASVVNAKGRVQLLEDSEAQDTLQHTVPQRHVRSTHAPPGRPRTCSAAGQALCPCSRETTSPVNRVPEALLLGPSEIC